MSKFIALLVLAFSFSSIGQERATFKRLKRDKEISKAFAEKSIQEITGGVLLVRLNFRQNQIDYLTKNNNISGANQARKKALNVNKKIVNAFSEKFDFCTVYFFKTSDSRFVRNQQFDSLTLFDHSLKKVDSAMIKPNNYLIGEFGRIKQDTTQYYSDEIRDTSVEKSKTKTYYGGSKNGREAFVIMDRDFNQIRKPFPYYSGLQAVLSEGVRFKKALEVINLKLHEYSTEIGASAE